MTTLKEFEKRNVKDVIIASQDLNFSRPNDQLNVSMATSRVISQ